METKKIQLSDDGTTSHIKKSPSSIEQLPPETVEYVRRVLWTFYNVIRKLAHSIPSQYDK